MQLDETKLKVELGYFLDAVKMLTSLVPGQFGSTLVAFLEAIDTDEVLSPAVTLVNGIVGDTK